MKIPRPSKTALMWSCIIGVTILTFWMGGVLANANYRRSVKNFARLELALLRYHDEHGAFPPTKFQPEAGGPIHSWRVLLLPYADQTFVETHSQYDYSHWWISPPNLQAWGREAPSVFRMHHEGYNGITHYLAIGDEDVWPSRSPRRSRMVMKDKDRFLLVEYPESEIHWMEPKF